MGTTAHDGEHGSSAPRRVEHVGGVVVAEVVGQQDVDGGLVEAMAVGVRVRTAEATGAC